MNYLVDYENVDMSGLLGMENLTENDKLTIFFSKKNCRVDFTVITLFASLRAKFELVCSDKIAANYNDFCIVCECSKILLTTDENTVVIISHDKGYGAASDYFHKLGKSVLIFPDILTAQKRLSKNATVIKNYLLEMSNKVKEPDAVSMPDSEPEIKPVPETKTGRTSKTKEVKDPVKKSPKKTKEKSKKEPKRNSRYFFKKPTAKEMCIIEHELYDKGYSKSDVDSIGQFIKTSKTYGELRFALIDKLGKLDADKTYEILNRTYFEVEQGLKESV